jgi:16S rRNA G527 N7-methylase RsmG
MADDAALLHVLQSLRERGAIGEVSLAGAVAHAASFVAAVPTAATALLDLGSGGGLPGLVIATRLPHLRIVLTDRRERRMDLLRRATSALGLDDRVTVITADVRALAARGEWQRSFDVVTARSFGSPTVTMACAAPFLRTGGALVVSEPPRIADAADGLDRWVAADPPRHGFTVDDVSFAQVRRLLRSSDPAR